MNRFIEKLTRISQTMPQPMGFRAAQPASAKPRMLLVASLESANTDSLAEQVAGADAGLLRIAKLNSGVQTLAKVSSTVPDIPWGGWLEGIAKGEVGLLSKSNFDFVVFPHRTQLTILEGEKADRILEIEESLSAGLLPAVDELPVDAVFVAAGREGFLTWQHLMFLQRCASLSAKPLLASIPPKISASELQALWGAGVSSVVAEVAFGQPADTLAKLRQLLDTLTLPPRRRKRVEALLPHTYTDEEIDAETEEE